MTIFTEQQQACIQAAAQGSDSLLVRSCAGSGKTTTGVEMLKVAKGERTACAFNVKNKEDLANKLPENIRVGTFNGLGARGWGKRIRKFEKVQQWKTYNIAEKMDINKDTFPDVLRAVGLAKAYGLVPREAPGGCGGLVEDAPENWEAITSTLDTGAYTEQTSAAIVRDIVLESIKRAWRGEMDFDDQLYMPAIYDGDFEPVDTLLVDEVQDVSPIQRAMFRRMNPKRIFALGDEHQSMYAFRGADHQSINNFTKDFGCRELNLTYSFRCPRAVVEEAHNWVDHIQPTPEAPEGSVQQLGEWGPKTLLPTDAIICRNFRPLLSIAMSCLRRGVAIQILGRDIGQGLVNLVRREGKGCVTIAQVIDRVGQWEETQHAKAKTELKRVFATDRAESVRLIGSGLVSMGMTRAEDLVKRIETMFMPGKNITTLSTVHKAKGLEWQRVLFLDQHLIPSRFATTPSELQQESNIAYVAVTRAKMDLLYVNSQDFER